jgi:hypothetical protein
MPLELALALTKCRDMAGRIHYGRLPSLSLKAASLSSSRHHVEERHEHLVRPILLAFLNVYQHHVAVNRHRISACYCASLDVSQPNHTDYSQ